MQKVAFYIIQDTLQLHTLHNIGSIPLAYCILRMHTPNCDIYAKKDLEYRIMQYESVMKNQKESKKRKMRTTRNTTPKDNITYLRYF